MLSKYEKIHLQALITSIIKCLNTFPNLPLTHCYSFSVVYGQQEFFFPESSRLAIIIPIPKPGKDHAEPTNYRPIALTSCFCKTLERLINQ